MNNFMTLMGRWTILLLPALAMWVPLGAEAWLLLVLTGMVSAWVLGWRPVEKIWTPNHKHIAYALAGIVGIKALSMFWSVAPQLTWHHTKLHLHLLLYVPLLVLFSQVPNAHQLFFRKALPLAIVPGAVWALLAWWNKGFPLGGFDFEGATKNSLILAILLTYVLCNVLFEYMHTRAPINLLWVFLALVIMAAGGKRSTILVTTIVMLFALWVYASKVRWGSHIQFRRSLGWLGLLIFSVCMLFVYLTRDKWLLAWTQTHQFFSKGYAGGSIDTRWELYSVAWEAFKQNVWLGKGAGTAREVIANSPHGQTLRHFNHYHNLILQSLSDLGVLGVAVLVYCLHVIQTRANRLVSGLELDIQLTTYTHLLVAVLYGLTNLSFGNILFHLTFVYLLAISTQKNYLSDTTPTR